MKNNFKFFLAILSVAFVFTACKKYDEGPALSLLTKKARISGEWRVEKEISAAGVEQLVQSQDVLSISKSGSFEIIEDNKIETIGTWDFIKDKEYISFTYKEDGVNNIEEFKIIRLKNRELWLKDIEGKQYNYVPA
ncbi:hypothetical protein [Brumimicrobium oceani]|uniref:Lipocalin-like domain-containing protein n=1 Tax=Brumimicrobium oceani TaxID=2100725 RepID=A0A2U2X334_9FLAO|nr:hypothetical protein [Brumimicrobium oceani]PWH82195.1 hypothetical protein DIT68_13895 [Brumimicrobium oceani]